jgi:tetratricopeptide (TPR) repeat protein
VWGIFFQRTGNVMRILWCGAMVLGVWCNAGAQTTPVLRPEIALIVGAASEALAAQNPVLALEKLDAANAVSEATPKEAEILQRLRVAAAISAGKPAVAMAALEWLIAAPEVAAIEKPTLIENLISLAQKQKDHQHVIDAGQLFGRIRATPTRGALLAVAQAHYFLKHYDLTAAQISTLLEPGANASNLVPGVQGKPEEYLLRMLADSYAQLKNRNGYLQALTLLLEQYPSQAYWSDYLSRHMSQLETGSPFALDWHRLVRATQTLEDADDYLEYVQQALKSGFPYEAQAVLEQGIKSGLLEASAYQRAVGVLRLQTARGVAEDAEALTLLEKRLPTAVNGEVAEQLADLHMASGRWTQAHSLYLSALGKGGLRRTELARVRRGIALARDGQKDAALTALVWSGQSPGARALAQAWTLWANQVLK